MKQRYAQTRRHDQVTMAARTITLTATLAAALISCTAQAQSTPIALMYYERPPFMIDTVDGKVSGLTADASAQAMRDAGLSFTWHKFGAKRILEVIRENRIPACGVGWFKSPEREEIAKFSKPIYRDRPGVAITPKRFSANPDLTVEKVLKNKANRILVKEGFTYGGINILIKQYQATQISTTVDITQMVQMIQANRADILFLADEEASYLLEQGGFRASDFNVLRFPDMPKGNLRHFMCSKLVPDSVIQKLNAAIHFE